MKVLIGTVLAALALGVFVSQAEADEYGNATPRLMAAGDLFRAIANPTQPRVWGLDCSRITGNATNERGLCRGELSTSAGRITSTYTVAYSTTPGKCPFRVLRRYQDQSGIGQAPAFPNACVRVISKRRS